MNLADAAPEPALVLGGAACVALSCLFVASAVVLVILLVRRNRRSPPSA
jgi:hypothetical protein